MKRTTTNNPLNSVVSFLNSIKQAKGPAVKHAPLGLVLDRVRSAEWQPQIEHIRSLRYGSTEQDAAKIRLPAFTPAGRFNHVKNAGLLEHSGCLPVDLDNLTREECLKTISRAVLDEHCIAAFHSTSGCGVKLLLHVPRMTATEHTFVFPQVADYVRSIYHVEPDWTGRNVSRLCFVSWDKGIWTNPEAKPLPLDVRSGISPSPASARLPRRRIASKPAQAVEAISPAVQSPKHGASRILGMEFAPSQPKPSGTYYTHKPLLKLANRLAIKAVKEQTSEADTSEMLHEAMSGWWNEAQRHNRKLNRSYSEYHSELVRAFRSARKAPATKQAANHWLQWRKHPKFPPGARTKEQVLFAIQQHCKANKTTEFFLSSRDAAAVTYAWSSGTGAKLLKALCADGQIVEVKKPFKRMRDSRSYRLLQST